MMPITVLCVVQPNPGQRPLVSPRDLHSYFSLYVPVSRVTITNRREIVEAMIDINCSNLEGTGLLFDAPIKAPFGIVTLNWPRTVNQTLFWQGGQAQAFGPPSVSRRWPNLPMAQVKSSPFSCNLPSVLTNSVAPTQASQSDALRSHGGLSPIFTPTLPSNKLSMSQDDKTEPLEERRVLIVNRIKPRKVRLQHLVSLFGQYGRISKVLLKPDSGYALVEFAEAQHARMAAENLQSVSLFGAKLKCKLSRFTTLNLKLNDQEMDKPTKQMFVHLSRFIGRSPGWESCRPPSANLRVSGCPASLTAPLLKAMLGQVTPPLMVTESEEPGQDQGCYTVYFKTVGQATDALATFDYQWVDDSRLTVEFIQPSNGSCLSI